MATTAFAGMTLCAVVTKESLIKPEIIRRIRHVSELAGKLARH